MSVAPIRPCGSCPYRLDVPSGIWAEEEYAKLPPYDAETPFQPVAIFYCHQGDHRICAGWAGCHDMEHALSVRMASGTMDLGDLEALLDYVSPVPLFDSGAAAAAHGLANIEAPDERAARAVSRLKRKGVGQ